MPTSLLSAQNVTLKRSGATLLNHVNLDLQAGELVGLIGPNGAGKSTLLGLLAGLDKPDAGDVHYRNQPIQQLSDNQRAQHIGWMEQLSAPHWPVTVEHLVMLGRIPYLTRWQSPSADDHERVHGALLATDCHHLTQRRVDTLSGGELTRVMLARVLASEPQVLLADEPIAALDMGHQLQILDVLRQFANGDNACVVVLHDLSLAGRYCDRLILLDQGENVASGAPRDVLTQHTVREVYGVETVAAGPDGNMLYPIKLSDNKH